MVVAARTFFLEDMAPPGAASTWVTPALCFTCYESPVHCRTRGCESTFAALFARPVHVCRTRACRRASYQARAALQVGFSKGAVQRCKARRTSMVVTSTLPRRRQSMAHLMPMAHDPQQAAQVHPTHLNVVLGSAHAALLAAMRARPNMCVHCVRCRALSSWLHGQACSCHAVGVSQAAMLRKSYAEELDRQVNERRLRKVRCRARRLSLRRGHRSGGDGSTRWERRVG